MDSKTIYSSLITVREETCSKKREGANTIARLRISSHFPVPWTKEDPFVVQNIQFLFGCEPHFIPSDRIPHATISLEITLN